MELVEKTWIFLVFIVLYTCLRSHVSSSTFYGTTERREFLCKCSGGAACTQSRGEDSGTCGAGCDDETLPWAPWWGEGCQRGNVAYGKPAVQTRDKASGTADKAVDGMRNRTQRGREYSWAIRQTGGDNAWWRVDLGDSYVVSDVQVVTVVEYAETVDSILVFVSSSDAVWGSSNWDSEDQCAGAVSVDEQQTIHVNCNDQIGRYVHVVEVDNNNLVMAEVVVNGYLYHNCQGEYLGDYHYGPACLVNCHCEGQCHQVTGLCSSQCKIGFTEDDCQQCAEGYCDQCDPGRWGYQCQELCNCLRPDEACDRYRGTCDNTPSFADHTIQYQMRETDLLITLDSEVQVAGFQTFYRLNYREYSTNDWQTVELSADNQMEFSVETFPRGNNILYEVRVQPVLQSVSRRRRSVGRRIEGISSPVVQVGSRCDNEQRDSPCNYWCGCGASDCLLTHGWCNNLCRQCDVILPNDVTLPVEITASVTSISLTVGHMEYVLEYDVLLYGEQDTDLRVQLNPGGSHVFSDLKQLTTYTFLLTPTLEVDGTRYTGTPVTKTATTLNDGGTGGQTDDEGSSGSTALVAGVVGGVVGVVVIVVVVVIIVIISRRTKNKDKPTRSRETGVDRQRTKHRGKQAGRSRHKNSKITTKGKQSISDSAATTSDAQTQEKKIENVKLEENHVVEYKVIDPSRNPVYLNGTGSQDEHNSVSDN